MRRVCSRRWLYLQYCVLLFVRWNCEGGKEEEVALQYMYCVLLFVRWNCEAGKEEEVALSLTKCSLFITNSSSPSITRCSPFNNSG